MNKRFLFVSLSSLFVCVVLLGTILWGLQLLSLRTEVIFLNVGQGDAILVSQGHNQILIDGGRSGKELLGRLGRHVPFWDRTIEVVIATHPDADHIGGFPDLFRSYTVKKYFSTGAESATDVSELLRRAIADNLHGEKKSLFRGATFELPKGGKLEVIHPFGPLPRETADTNEGSLVAKFHFGGTSFLLTGDLPREEELLLDIKPATVLKASHHGSKYSTSEAFLGLVRPKEAVISVGKNRYGHPSQDVLARLKNRGVTIYRTDQEGDIVYHCEKDACIKK